jgi:hypothetical protein
VLQPRLALGVQALELPTGFLPPRRHNHPISGVRIPGPIPQDAARAVG